MGKLAPGIPGLRGAGQSAQSQRPGRNTAETKEIQGGPRIILKKFRDFVRATRTRDEENIRRVFQRSSEDDKTFPMNAIHERSMGIPFGLIFQPEAGVPSGARVRMIAKSFMIPS